MSTFPILEVSGVLLSDQGPLCCLGPKNGTLDTKGLIKLQMFETGISKFQVCKYTKLLRYARH